MSLDEFFRLHLRLTEDTSTCISGVCQFRQSNGQITVTDEGKDWLKDYYRYERIHRSLNGQRFRGTGPADKALSDKFGYVLDEEDV